MTTTTLPVTSLDQIFGNARSNHRYQPRAVGEETVRELYELTKLAPTGFNSQPARFVFIRSAEARERLGAVLSSSNRDKALAAPLNAIVAWDSAFPERLPQIHPCRDLSGFFTDPAKRESAGVFNTALQAGFLIVAARSLGLDAGPMTGFDAAALDRAFFPDGRYRSLLVLNLGYGDRSQISERCVRLSFEDVVQVL